MFSMEAGGTVAEIELLPFARLALQVARSVLPAYRSPISRHSFNQPQLLAVLCLMRFCSFYLESFRSWNWSVLGSSDAIRIHVSSRLPKLKQLVSATIDLLS